LVYNRPTGRLSLAIPPWVGAMNTRQSWGVSSHNARCTIPNPWSGSLSRCLAEETDIRAAPWALWLGTERDFTFCLNVFHYICYNKFTTDGSRWSSVFNAGVQRLTIDQHGPVSTSWTLSLCLGGTMTTWSGMEPASRRSGARNPATSETSVRLSSTAAPHLTTPH